MNCDGKIVQDGYPENNGFYNTNREKEKALE